MSVFRMYFRASVSDGSIIRWLQLVVRRGFGDAVERAAALDPRDDVDDGADGLVARAALVHRAATRCASSLSTWSAMPLQSGLLVTARWRRR